MVKEGGANSEWWQKKAGPTVSDDKRRRSQQWVMMKEGGADSEWRQKDTGNFGEKQNYLLHGCGDDLNNDFLIFFECMSTVFTWPP